MKTINPGFLESRSVLSLEPGPSRSSDPPMLGAHKYLVYDEFGLDMPHRRGNLLMTNMRISQDVIISTVTLTNNLIHSSLPHGPLQTLSTLSSPTKTY